MTLSPCPIVLIAPVVQFLERIIGAKCRRCVFVPANRIFYVLCLSAPITDSPEVTGSAYNVPSSTSNQSTITPGATSPASSSSNSNTGAIAGGVVGGVVGVALIVGLVAWFAIRRKRHHAPSADYISSQESDMAVVPYPIDVARPKLYVRILFFSFGHVKAYETVIDRIIVLPRILQTQAHTRRGKLLRRSTRPIQVDNISALHRTCNPTEWYTTAFQRSDSLNFVPSSRTFPHVLA